jgi:hypothetical protein
MSGERRRLIIGERTTLDAIIASPDDGVSPRDRRDLMELPFVPHVKSRLQTLNLRRGGAP